MGTCYRDSDLETIGWLRQTSDTESLVILSALELDRCNSLSYFFPSDALNRPFGPWKLALHTRALREAYCTIPNCTRGFRIPVVGIEGPARVYHP